MGVMAVDACRYRAVAWYLYAGKERSELDAQQWKGHSEQLEGELEEGKRAWASKEQSFEQQIKDINVSGGGFWMDGWSHRGRSRR